MSSGEPMAKIAEVELSKDGAVSVRRVVCAVDCGTHQSRYRPGADQARDHLRHHGGSLWRSRSPSKTAGSSKPTSIATKCGAPFDGIGEAGTSAIVPAVTKCGLAATGRRLRKLPIDPTAFEAAGVNGTVSRCVRSRGGSKLWTMWTSGFPLKLFRQLSPAGGIHVFSCRVLLCTTRCEIHERHKCALTARSLLIDGERAHRAIARRYQFALSQVFTKTLWPAIFPQGTYRVQCHCPSCRARSRRPEGRIISAEFVPVVLSRRDASRVGRPCDAD
jgi:hypothetical protein